MPTDSPRPSDAATCSRRERIERANRIHGTDFQLGQVVSYDAGKGRGRRLATVTDGCDAFLKIMRDGGAFEYGALWDPGELRHEAHPENTQPSGR